MGFSDSKVVDFNYIEVAGFSEAGWSECLGESVDLGFDLGGRIEGKFMDEEFGGG